jgi:proline iminopeptidase
MPVHNSATQIIQKNMKEIVTLFLALFTTIDINGQGSKYDHSFIKFHLYGKGEPVFVLSGGPGNDCHQEEEVALKIAEKYQAILLEQRGTGMSMPETLDSNSINLEAYLSDILFVMDSLKIKNAKFYGHSWGAVYASTFAISYPEKVRNLTLTGVGQIKLDKGYQARMIKNRLVKLNDTQLARYEILAQKEEFTEEEKLESTILRATFNTYDTTNREIKFRKIMRGVSNDKTNALMRADFVRIKFDITSKLKDLKMPISIITCKEDPLAFLTEEYKRFAPQAKVKWISKCGHFPMYEQPTSFYPLLMTMLKR